MRSEALFLRDIVEAADHIENFLQDFDLKAFAASELVQSAVLQKLMVIGEAASKVSDELRADYPQIPWKQVVGFRNIAIHAYFTIDLEIVWTTAVSEVPEIRSVASMILAERFGGSAA